MVQGFSRSDANTYTSFDVLNIYEAILNKVWVYSPTAIILFLTFPKNLNAQAAMSRLNADQSSDANIRPYAELLESLR